MLSLSANERSSTTHGPRRLHPLSRPRWPRTILPALQRLSFAPHRKFIANPTPVNVPRSRRRCCRVGPIGAISRNTEHGVQVPVPAEEQPRYAQLRQQHLQWKREQDARDEHQATLSLEVPDIPASPSLPQEPVSAAKEVSAPVPRASSGESELTRRMSQNSIATPSRQTIPITSSPQTRSPPAPPVAKAPPNPAAPPSPSGGPALAGKSAPPPPTPFVGAQGAPQPAAKGAPQPAASDDDGDKIVYLASTYDSAFVDAEARALAVRQADAERARAQLAETERTRRAKQEELALAALESATRRREEQERVFPDEAARQRAEVEARRQEEENVKARLLNLNVFMRGLSETMADTPVAAAGTQEPAPSRSAAKPSSAPVSSVTGQLSAAIAAAATSDGAGGFAPRRSVVGALCSAITADVAASLTTETNAPAASAPSIPAPPPARAGTGPPGPYTNFPRHPPAAAPVLAPDSGRGTAAMRPDAAPQPASAVASRATAPQPPKLPVANTGGEPGAIGKPVIRPAAPVRPRIPTSIRDRHEPSLQQVQPRVCPGPAPTPSDTPRTSAPGLGSPRPHLHRDWAHPCASLQRMLRPR